MSLDGTVPQIARSGSLAEQAYHAVRASIADGRLAPGARITERNLAAALDISPTPVREAISKLEHEGLLERVGVRRLQVADHPAETLHELREIEVMLRGAEARFAARKISPETVARMRRSVEELVEGRASLSLAEQYAMAQLFDAEIARAAANPALRSLIDSYGIYATDYRRQAAEHDAKSPKWVATRIEQHRALVEALAARDEDEAERVMRGLARPSIREL